MTTQSSPWRVWNGLTTDVFCYVIFYRRNEPEPEDWSSYESHTSEVTDKSKRNRAKPKKNVQSDKMRHGHTYEDSPEGIFFYTFTVLKNLY